MATSTVVYIPHLTCKHAGCKDAVAVIQDAEHQMVLRAERKGELPPIFGVWRNCREDPGIWELTTANPTMSTRNVSLEELRTDDTIDPKILNLACG